MSYTKFSLECSVEKFTCSTPTAPTNTITTALLAITKDSNEGNQQAVLQLGFGYSIAKQGLAVHIEGYGGNKVGILVTLLSGSKAKRINSTVSEALVPVAPSNPPAFRTLSRVVPNAKIQIKGTMLMLAM